MSEKLKIALVSAIECNVPTLSDIARAYELSYEAVVMLAADVAREMPSVG